MEENETTKWINPETKRKAIQRARDRTNAAKWNLDVAVVSFGILAIVLILSFERISIWITASISILGLAMIWLIGWRRAGQMYSGFLDEELAQCLDDWKDYYKILRIGPSADFKTIAEAHEQFYHLFHDTLSKEAKQIPLYSLIIREADEAYQVLSDLTSRTAYDRIFWLKYNATGSIGIDESAKYELVSLSQSITAKLSEAIREITWNIPLLDKITRPVAVGVVVVLLSVLLGGTSIAFAKPEHTLAIPFRGIAITLTKTSAGTVGLIEDVRGMVTTFELSVVSTALQSMRIEENLKEIPTVTVSTDDMTHFPSQEHPLFPDYLDKRFSQFKYTVDSKGIISVDTSWTITDSFLDKIEQTLNRLERSE